MGFTQLQFAAVVSVVVATSSSAQQVRGRVVLTDGTTPVLGIIVQLVDSAGGLIDRALSDNRGQYRLHATRNGRYRLRALRIGYEPTHSPVFALDSAQSAGRDIVLTGIAIALGEVRIVATQQCETNPESGTLTALAWVEARKALEATLVTRTRRYEVEVARFDRRKAPGSQRVIRETESEERGASIRPFISIPTADLDTSGYVRTVGDEVVLHAPDEEVLLSEQFAATHCFRLESRGTGEELIVAFEPTKERTLPDIRGAIYLSRTTGALSRLDFQYVNLPEHLRALHPEGSVAFEQLQTGGWIVKSWVIRYPDMSPQVRAGRQHSADFYRGDATLQAVGQRSVWEAGGEVTRVLEGDSVIWQGLSDTLVGRVRDVDGRNVSRAIITIASLKRRTVSDDSGRFRLPHVRPALRTVVVSTPFQDSLGVQPFVVESDSRRVSDVNLVVPSDRLLLQAACAAEEETSDAAGYIRGTTRGQLGERAANVELTFTWFAPLLGAVDGSLGMTRTIRTRSDAYGDYVVCGPRTDHPIAVRAYRSGATVAEQTVRVPSTSRVLLLDIPIKP